MTVCILCKIDKESEAFKNSSHRYICSDCNEKRQQDNMLRELQGINEVKSNETK